MNAPWTMSQRTANGAPRDQFAAFLCDEDTLEALKPVANELNWPHEKIFKGGMRNAIQTLAVSASPQILLIDLSESEDPIQDINSLAEVCEPGTVVLTLGNINDVGFYRDLMTSGIHDYLLKPANSDALRQSLLSAQTTLHAPKSAVTEEIAVRHLVPVIGVRGGVGASMIATSLASVVANHHGLQTALLDLDIHFGTGALCFDLEPGRGLTDALENPNRIDSLFIERAMVKDNDKLSILSAEAPINAPMISDPNAYHQLQHEVRSGFECVIVDMPRHMAVQHPELLSEASVIYLITEMSLSGTRDTIRMLAMLKNAAPNANILVVANKVAASGDPEVSRKDYEASIERQLHAIIPLDTKAAITSAKMGRPFTESAKASKASMVIKELAKQISAISVVGEAEKQSSVKDKLAPFKALLNRKKS